jgi:REP element-mobilizing transposase RayT
MGCHVQRLASQLRRASTALYRLFLLSAVAIAEPSSQPRPLAVDSRKGARYRFVVVGYVVMPEHMHLLITEPETGNPSKVMQVLKQRRARALLCKRKDPPQDSLFGENSQPRSFWQARFYDFNVWSSKKRVEKSPRLNIETWGTHAVHASESGQTRAGGVCGAMAMEQLSFLSSQRSPCE